MGIFFNQGQVCCAGSRLFLHEEVKDEFLDNFKNRAAKVKVGDPMNAATQMGPQVSEEQLNRIKGYVDIARGEGATVLTGGEPPKLEDKFSGGYFFQPTIFAGVKQGSRLEQEEIFGPVLSVVKVRDADEAFAVNNGVRYGLSSSIYTRDVNTAFRALNELDNGITYVNAPTIGAEAHLPFGGVKQTGNGHREGGWEVYEFYSETKVGYADFSGTLQRAQIDNYLGSPD